MSSESLLDHLSNRSLEEPDFIESALKQLRSLPCPVWQGAVGSVYMKRVTGQGGKAYELSLSANWIFAGARDICVMVTMKRPWWRQMMSETFVITSTNAILTSS